MLAAFTNYNIHGQQVVLSLALLTANSGLGKVAQKYTKQGFFHVSDSSYKIQYHPGSLQGPSSTRVADIEGG